MSTEPTIDPGEYVRLLRSCRLQGIRLVAANVERRTADPASVDLQFDVKEEGAFEVVQAGDYRLTMQHVLTAKDAGDRRRTGLRIMARYEAVLSASEELADEFLRLYVGRNLAFNTWPYFRQFVATMTSEADLPRLTLPLRLIAERRTSDP